MIRRQWEPYSCVTTIQRDNKSPGGGLEYSAPYFSAKIVKIPDMKTNFHVMWALFPFFILKLTSKTDMIVELNSSKLTYFRNENWGENERKVRRHEYPTTQWKTMIRFCAFLYSTALIIIPCYCPLGYLP